MTTPMTSEDEDALTIAMTVAPGVYSRNRMFDFFKSPAVKRARGRAATLRGAVPQLARACSVSVTAERGRRHGEPLFVLRYQVAALRMSRLLELTRAELAALRWLAARAAVATLPLDAEDVSVVERGLARLLRLGFESSAELEAVARSSPPPSA